jgi:peptidoglycan hydrolase CwlO-like protein
MAIKREHPLYIQILELAEQVKGLVQEIEQLNADIKEQNAEIRRLQSLLDGNEWR